MSAAKIECKKSWRPLTVVGVVGFLLLTVDLKAPSHGEEPCNGDGGNNVISEIHGAGSSAIIEFGSARDGDVTRDSEPWASWRGADLTRFVKNGTSVTRFGADRYRWKTPLPGKGCSTPIVVKDQIFLTAPVDGADAVLCFDRQGKLLFQTKFGQESAGKHRRGSGCNASPVSDGQRVFVYFKSGTFAAIDRSGDVIWDMNLVEKYGREVLYWDHGSSPILTTKHVVMARMDERDSWLAAFDKESGELAWKVERNYETPQECDHGYSTPIVIEFQGQESILTWGAEHVTIHAALDGRLLWSCGRFNPEKTTLWPTIASPVVVGKRVIVAYGRADRGIPRLFGLALEGEGDVTQTAHVWDRDDVGSFIPTPIVHGDKVIVLGDRGDLVCIDPISGDTEWRHQYPRARDNFYASPILIGQLLYTVRENGMAYVAKLNGSDFEIIAENDMGQPIIGSPIPFEDGLLLRGESDLFFVADEK